VIAIVSDVRNKAIRRINIISKIEGVRIKYTANLITIGRITGAVLLLFVKPLSVSFFAIYILCGISDILDGYIARKTKTSSKSGEILDSIADLIFIAVMLVIFIPLLAWRWWMLCWVGGIALVRFLSVGVGFAKYHAVSFLHTYANKITGIILFGFPLLYYATGLTVTVSVICCFASLSAFEELIITIRSKRLNRNVASIFYNKGKYTP